MRSDNDPALPLANMLRAARQRLSLSLQEEANRVNQEAAADGVRGVASNRKRVHSWEGGEIPRPNTLRWLARALDLDLDQVTTAAQEQMRRRQGGRPPAVAVTPTPRLAPQGLPVHHGADEPRDPALVERIPSRHSGQVGACTPLVLWSDGQPVLVRLVVVDMDVDETTAPGRPPRRRLGRRTFISAGTAGGLGALSAMAVPASGLMHLSSVDPRVFDYLEREADRLPRDIWSGSLAAQFPRVEDAYALADALLGQLPRLRDQVRLHRLTARLAILRALGEVFHNRLDPAEGWYRIAGERAVEAGDPGLALWALAKLAFMRARAGAAPQKVLEIAAEARHRGGGQPGAAAAQLAGAEARAHARLGDRTALMQALHLAEAELARAVPEERVPSVFGRTDAMARYDAAAAWVLAGEPQEAEHEARQAIALYAPWHRTDLAVVRLYLATALADQGRPDEACAVACEALPRAGHPDDHIRARSSQIVQAVTEFDPHLDRYQTLPAVQEFRELVTSTGIRA